NCGPAAEALLPRAAALHRPSAKGTRTGPPAAPAGQAGRAGPGRRTGRRVRRRARDAAAIIRPGPGPGPRQPAPGRRAGWLRDAGRGRPSSLTPGQAAVATVAATLAVILSAAAANGCPPRAGELSLIAPDRSDSRTRSRFPPVGRIAMPVEVPV